MGTNLPWRGKNTSSWLSKRRWLSRTLKRMEPGGRVYEFKWMGDTTFTTYVTPPPKSTEIDAVLCALRQPDGNQ
ncbi:MAG: hypothetical protein H6559_34280 [Lewinellaceae bacterium]|nr:hypothetical protein [Lewinellaceae bacterium]